MSGLLKKLKAEYSKLEQQYFSPDSVLENLPLWRTAQGFVWQEVKTVYYECSSHNLDSVRKAKLGAQQVAKIIEKIQGYKPKIKFKGIRKK